MRLAALIFALTAAAPLTLPHPAEAQWTIQTPTTADLRGIDNVGKGIAWASGANGTVLRTEDAGYLWQTCTIPPGAEHLDFRAIQAFDANTAIVMSSGPGDQSRLYKTTDGCQTWKLIITNPDKDGFWDGLRFNKAPQYKSSATDDKLHLVPVEDSRYIGVLIGDPIGGKFVIYTTTDSGDTWFPWSDKSDKATKALPKEALFAASNSSLILPGINSLFAFVTGGANGSRLVFPEHHGRVDGGGWISLTKLPLPFLRSESAGAFSIAAHYTPEAFSPDIMVVGGDYKQPSLAEGTAFFIPASSLDVLRHARAATTPPHGYRSAVAYDSKTKTWITVGPNGTDISTDDGRNWRPLLPAPGEAPDTAQHWNALSLPYAVGPHGRIGILNPSALQPSPAK
jgi:hypothetical protein